jgi:hypothetical protein
MRLLLRILSFIVAVLGTTAPPLEAQGAGGHHRWSVSTSLTFPLVRIYQVYVNYRIRRAKRGVRRPGLPELPA